MLSSWNWRTRVRLSVFVAATLLLLVVGFLCSRFDDDQYRTLMNNIPDDHSNVDTSTTIKMNHPSKGRPSDPPILAYWIFGFRGESKRMLRLLKAVYHPRNQYLLHLLDGDGYEERMELAVSVESEHVFRAFGNVNVVGKSYAVEESGASALSAMLHASALLLRISPLWDWFFTLSSSDYPLFTQDDILFALTSLPRDLNFVGFTNRTIDRNRQHNVNRIVVDPSLHLKHATPLYYAVETREMPTTFDIFQGSPWMVLSRGFMEHCIKGFRWDRQWLVVNSKGRAYTQRVEPKLALVEVALPIEAFSEGWEPNNDSYLVIRAPGMDPLKIPLSDPSVVSDGVSVWEWSGSALDEGAEAAMWFSTHLGKPSRLVRFSEVKEMRVVDPNYAQGYNVMFSDGYPYLMLSQGSLNALNSLLKEPVPVNRFRPNVLVDGCEPFAEDLWKDIQINKLTFEGVKLCSRCKVPTINQETTVAGSEPTETLLKFRSDKALRPNKKQQGKVYFGQNMVCSDALSHGKGKIVKVGDPVYVHKVVPSSAEAPA